MQQNEPIIFTRSQIGQWASYIGGIGLLIGAVGWIWQGGITPIILGALAIGAAGIGLWYFMVPAEFRDFFSGRQAQYGTLAVFGTLMLIGIVAVVYVILQRSVITVDMTQGQRYTLSNETLTVLRRVTQPIRITGFYSPRSLQLREIDDQFFRQYEVESQGMITREYINPDEQPAVTSRFNATYDGEVFISFLNADGSINYDTIMEVPSNNKQESDMTQAISRLLISGTVHVYFETSHGELDIQDVEQRGLARINNGVQSNGLITLPLSIFSLSQTGDNIPQDAAAVILARPVSDFTEGEVAVLDRYLKAGGALFIMADVLYNQDAFLRQDSLFNQYLWDNFGIKALDAAIVDPAYSQQTPLDIYSAAVFQNNSITQRIDSQNSPAIFSVAKALEVNQTPPSSVTNGPLILSSDQSYGETNLQLLGETNTYTYDQGQDLVGPLTTAAYAYNQSTGGKIVLVGDSDWVTNGLVITGGNAVFFTDALSWLTGFGERVNFSSQVYTTGLPTMFISGEMLDVIAFLTVVLLPGVILAIGIGVWMRRARA